MLSRLRCFLNTRHRIDLLRYAEHGNVQALVFTCPCGKERVTREAVRATVDAFAGEVA